MEGPSRGSSPADSAGALRLCQPAEDPRPRGSALALWPRPPLGFRQTGIPFITEPTAAIPSLKGTSAIGKGNHSQKTDKKNEKPKQDKTKTPVKK